MDINNARLIAEFLYAHIYLVMGFTFIVFGSLYGKLNRNNGGASLFTIVLGFVLSLVGLTGVLH